MIVDVKTYIKNNKNVIKNFFKVLYEIRKPLSAYQAEELKTRWLNAEHEMTELLKIAELDDIDSYSVTEICNLFKILPSDVHPKYAGRGLKTLRKEFIDVKQIKENAEKQFNNAEVINSFYIDKHGVQRQKSKRNNE